MSDRSERKIDPESLDEDGGTLALRRNDAVHESDFPHRFRTRLTIAFVLVAALAAGLLALTSLILVRSHRFASFEKRSREQGELALSLAARQADPSQLANLVSVAQAQEGFEVIATAGGRSASSWPGIDETDVPEALRQDGRAEKLASAVTEVRGVPYLVVGGTVSNSSTRVYLFFSQRELLEGLRHLEKSLLAGWLLMVLLAALVGNWIARRTLLPVRAAAGAAQSIAEGLLDTRLEVRAKDEFGSWAYSFNKMAAALEDKISKLSDARDRERRFTSDVAHELRTPLAAMVSAASLLRNHLDDVTPDARRPAELLIGGVQRLRRLVLDLLELSRMDAGRQSVAMEPVAVDEVAAAVVHLVSSRCKVEQSLDRVWIETDRRRLERIVFNLVDNAIEHGKRGVRVRTFSQGDTAVIEVEDAGDGIAPECLPYIFDRFYKADHSRCASGSGLGLAIALENARFLGTTIEVWSRPGEGARFTVRFPVLQRQPGGELTVTSEEEALR